MLILSRYRGEKIVITSPKGEQITIMVTDVVGKAILADGRTQRPKAKLGIDAPKDFTVHRQEVQKVVDAEKGNLP